MNDTQETIKEKIKPIKEYPHPDIQGGRGGWPGGDGQCGGTYIEEVYDFERGRFVKQSRGGLGGQGETGE